MIHRASSTPWHGKEKAWRSCALAIGSCCTGASLANPGGPVDVGGAVLGALVAVGVLVTNALCGGRLRRGLLPKWKVVLSAATLAGLLAGSTVRLRATPSPLLHAGPRAVAIAVGLSWALQISYVLRWRVQKGRLLVVLILSLVACTALRGWAGALLAETWTLLAALLDPAWSLERWARCSEPSQASCPLDRPTA